jgi:MerR family transcriptional regulator, light-induced transcriptional regulator
MPEPFLVRYMQPLLGGRRAECFELISEALRAGTPAETLICDVIWPATAQIERLYNDDRINAAAEHMACRINRTAADQLQAHLTRRPPRGRRVLVASADTEGQELGAQIVADLFQADGWEVFFVGGGVPDDEILSLVGQLRPHMLLIFGAHPEAVANTRAMVERIRDVGVCPTMNIVVTGGIFNRADGLWQEIGADAFCDTPRGVLATANELGPREPRTQVFGIVKRRRRRRKTALATA